MTVQVRDADRRESRYCWRTHRSLLTCHRHNSGQAPDDKRGSEVLELPGYVIVTPARNEAEFLELTIQSVLAQTVRPLRWVIVSDGSTDGTEDIVSKYSEANDWIELVSMPARHERNFAGKVHAINAGRASLEALPYEVVAFLDADITIEKDYFSFLLGKLASDATLGLVGTRLVEMSGETYDYRFVNVEHVSGACQVFRRECFDAIGGYQPMKCGAIDWVATTTARMKGWKTSTFTGKCCMHQRVMGTAQCGPLMARFKQGVKDYLTGNHPVWELFRSAYQMTKRPFVLRGMALGAGYFWAAIQRKERPVSRELMAFHRREQMGRLKKLLTRKWASEDNSAPQQGRAHDPR